MDKASPSPTDVFINVPFDTPYEQQFLALIAGVVGLGLNPRSVIELPPSRDRMSRLLDIIRACPYSLHDLSRVQLSRDRQFRVPRFNMPFELGLTLGVTREADEHEPVLMEAVANRLKSSLSDLDAFDPVIHSGTVEGMFDALLDIFGDRPDPPLESTSDLAWVYRGLKRFRTQQRGPIYRPNAFRRLVIAARGLVKERVGQTRS